jgi:hypothetical protein
MCPGAVYTVALPQLPSMQPWPDPQVCPQEPQLALSVFRSTHPPLHGSVPTRHVFVQPRPEQTSPLGHFALHAPQLSGFALTDVQTPLQLI